MSKKAQELRDLSVEELEAKCTDERKELFKLTNEKQQSRRQFEKPHRIRQARHSIARILTILQQKKQEKSSA